MPDIDHARALLEAARRDLRALEAMGDAGAFADEIFGFHAQQAVEKGLKAWLALNGVTYPRTHDLRVLLGLLQRCGVDVSTIQGVMEYGAYAVAFRYEALPLDADPLDRRAALERVRDLLGRVEHHLTQLDAGA